MVFKIKVDGRTICCMTEDALAGSNANTLKPKKPLLEMIVGEEVEAMIDEGTIPFPCIVVRTS